MIKEKNIGQRKPVVILIGNYTKDNQESMERFADMLSFGILKDGCIVEIWRPKVIFGRFFESISKGIGMGKWLGYIDKWVIFPTILKYRLIRHKSIYKQAHFHICDHSNAPYLPFLPQERCSITCHDVLAIRGAMGFADAYCEASRLGIYLQQWILKNLLKAKKIAAVSSYTLRQLKELAEINNKPGKNWLVIPNAFNAEFNQMSPEVCQQILSKQGLCPKDRFILHVGSELKRKNRQLLLQMVANLGTDWDGKIYFAGKGLDRDLENMADNLKLKQRVVSIIKPSHDLLLALYSSCEVFVFPSLSEGFGWPIIEAQACGAPVITSNYDPMTEVSGRAAMFADPNKPEDFAEAFLTLKDENKRNWLVHEGFANVKRYELETVINTYLVFFGIKTIE